MRNMMTLLTSASHRYISLFQRIAIHNRKLAVLTRTGINETTCGINDPTYLEVGRKRSCTPRR